MLSTTFMTTFALALMSASPAFAQSRGRPNHADLYGYPHGRGDHSGTRAPVPINNQPMTPGGYVDPRPANPGSVCTANSQCSTDVRNARASCGADGICSFQCLGNTVFDGTSCAGQIQAPRCSFDRQCPTSVDNAQGRCISGRCSFACNTGFYASGSTCAVEDQVCGNVTCPDVQGGYTVCVDGQCTARCEAQLGFKQYCNADNTVCQCINTTTDVNSCGTPGNVCPPSYNGKGKAFCAQGRCGLSCYRLTKVQPREGDAYCT